MNFNDLVLMFKNAPKDNIELFIKKTIKKLPIEEVKSKIDDKTIDFLMGWHYHIESRSERNKKKILKELIAMIFDYLTAKGTKEIWKAFTAPTKAHKQKLQNRSIEKIRQINIERFRAIREDLEVLSYSNKREQLISDIDRYIQDIDKYFPNHILKIKANVEPIRKFLKSHNVSNSAITELIKHLDPD
ncbi:MAG: hypothetical protein LBQ18_05375 [Campylobacteraceae bacterium]|jgi:hypothetical protein|nr:hypothetical protein [Campylobacteraceae bacterium]